MSVQVVFETHSWSEDNDRGVATGWTPGALSAKGRALASELGERRRNDGIAAVYTSDLRRATETAEIAFRGSEIPILHDWRLRECNYGSGLTGAGSNQHGIGNGMVPEGSALDMRWPARSCHWPRGHQLGDSALLGRLTLGRTNS